MANVDQDQIINDVKDQLVWDAQVDATDIDVSVDENGVVTLTGTVPSFSAQRAARLDAWSVLGVTGVNSELTVTYPEAITLPSDDEIESNVENVLLWNASVDSTDIDVGVTAGVVTLEGSVSSFWRKLRAEDLAEDVVGVISVTNNLAVVPTESYVDADIATDIVDSLERKAAVNADNVNIRVEEGRVTLSGTVPSFNAWSLAYDSARFTAGVIDVEDELTIV